MPTNPYAKDLIEFHRATKCAAPDKPTLDGYPFELRVKLLLEEVIEFASASGVAIEVRRDPAAKCGASFTVALRHDEAAPCWPDMIDAIVDVLYVAFGAATSMGIDIEPFWRAVHAANMAKTTGPKRADGKVLKPEGWRPPDIERVLTHVLNPGEFTIASVTPGHVVASPVDSGTETFVPPRPPVDFDTARITSIGHAFRGAAPIVVVESPYAANFATFFETDGAVVQCPECQHAIDKRYGDVAILDWQTGHKLCARARNDRYLACAVGDCYVRGESPYASHAIGPLALDDDEPGDRELSIRAGFEFHRVATRMVVYTDLGISRGMLLGMANARRLGLPIEQRSLGADWDSAHDVEVEP